MTLKNMTKKYTTPSNVIESSVTNRLLNAVYACPNGIIRMSDDIPGLVETSTNLASIKMHDGKNIEIVTSQRSCRGEFSVGHGIGSG